MLWLPHTTMKFIAKIVAREIILRDASAVSVAYF
jgi:hypothetical protein